MNFPLIIAYNMPDKKIGCALLQPLLGGTLSGGDLSVHFETDQWEMSPEKCKLFTINTEEEFQKVKEITSFYNKPKTKTNENN